MRGDRLRACDEMATPVAGDGFVPLATRPEPGGTKPSLSDAFVPLAPLTAGNVVPA